MNIVIPMAGLGSRFTEAGYVKPKPFIDVAGKPMIVRVLENMALKDARYILIARAEHMQRERALIKEIESDYNALFLPLDHLTEGTVCTVLHARNLINTEEPLMIANSDQIVDIQISDFVADCNERQLDGSILTFINEKMDNHWSYAIVDDKGLVTEVKEKVAISDIATVGIYLYSKGSDFVDAAIDMIVANDRVNNEFYSCPTYNYAVNNGLEIGIYDIPYETMHGLGVPKDLENYLGFLSKS